MKKKTYNNILLIAAALCLLSVSFNAVVGFVISTCCLIAFIITYPRIKA